MSLACPGKSDSHLGQHIARDAFLTVLNDPELQFEVRKSDPHTLEEAVKLASRIEISRAAVEPAASGRQRVNRRVEDQPNENQLAEVEIATTPRCVPADIRRQPEDGVMHKRRGEMSPASFSSPRKRGRRVRADAPADNGQMEEMARRLQPVSYTHLTLPTNREV